MLIGDYLFFRGFHDLHQCCLDTLVQQLVGLDDILVTAFAKEFNCFLLNLRQGTISAYSWLMNPCHSTGLAEIGGTSCRCQGAVGFLDQPILFLRFRINIHSCQAWRRLCMTIRRCERGFMRSVAIHDNHFRNR